MMILDLINSWLHYLKNIKNYSANTVESYKFDVDSFFDQAKRNNNGIYDYNDFVNINHGEIRNWLINRKNCNISHRSNLRAFSALKNFIKYLNKYKNFPNEQVFLFNLRNNINSLPKPVSFSNILTIINSINNKSLWIKKRNQVLIILLYVCGLRISEALNLKINDISETRFLKIYGKGGKERAVPLIENVYFLLKEYILILPFNNDVNNYVFCNNRGKKLSRISIAKYLIDIRNKLCLEKTVSAHAFRHSFATHLINSDVDLRDIQLLLGHSNITTTEIYTKVETSSLINDYKKFHPRNE